jgi:putative addiction module component (TIGR02574 family)
VRPKELIAGAISLPVEERAILVDSILRSLNSPEADIDRQWITEAERRLNEVRTGRARTIPGDQVFARIRKRSAE